MPSLLRCKIFIKTSLSRPIIFAVAVLVGLAFLSASDILAQEKAAKQKKAKRGEVVSKNLHLQELELIAGLASQTEQFSEVADTAVINSDPNAVATDQDSATDLTPTDNPPVNIVNFVTIGEKLTYNVAFGGLPAGELTLHTKRKTPLRGSQTILFEMQAKTNDVISVFFPMVTTLKSYIEADTGTSLLFLRDTKEGSYSADDRTEFDYSLTADSTPVIRYIKFNREENTATAPQLHPLTGRVVDPLGIFYLFRQEKFAKIGDSYPYFVGDRSGVDLVKAQVLKYETLKLRNIGKFDTVVVRMLCDLPADGKKTLSDYLKNGARLWLDRKTNIPLKVEVPIPKRGKVVCTLTKVENSPLVRTK